MLISHAVQIGSGTAYAKELTKWEAHHTQYGPPGRPYEYREYPTMLYRASRPAKGGEPLFAGVQADTDRDRERLETQGYVHGGKAAALEALEKQEFEFAELAANRHFTDRKMSESAQAEAAAADESTVRHLPAVPEKPVKRRGRPAKVKEAPSV